MGTFYTGCRIENVEVRSKAAAIPKILVDTESEYTWVAETNTLEGLNLRVDPRLKKLVAAGPVLAA